MSPIFELLRICADRQTLLNLRFVCTEFEDVMHDSYLWKVKLNEEKLSFLGQPSLVSYITAHKAKELSQICSLSMNLDKEELGYVLGEKVNLEHERYSVFYYAKERELRYQGQLISSGKFMIKTLVSRVTNQSAGQRLHLLSSSRTRTGGERL